MEIQLTMHISQVYIQTLNWEGMGDMGHGEGRWALVLHTFHYARRKTHDKNSLICSNNSTELTHK